MGTPLIRPDICRPLVTGLTGLLKTSLKSLYLSKSWCYPCSNTGSEQGKKRKRQDSTKESQNVDVKEAGPKQKKKAKLGGHVRHDSYDTDEPNTKQNAKNTLVTKKNGKSNTTQNSGKERSISEYSTANYNITKAKRALWLVNSASTICPWVYAADLLNN